MCGAYDIGLFAFVHSFTKTQHADLDKCTNIIFPIIEKMNCSHLTNKTVDFICKYVYQILQNLIITVIKVYAVASFCNTNRTLICLVMCFFVMCNILHSPQVFKQNKK